MIFWVIGSIRVMKSGLFVLRLLEDFFFIRLSHIYFFGTFVELNFMWNMACGMGIRNIYFLQEGETYIYRYRGIGMQTSMITYYIYLHDRKLICKNQDKHDTNIRGEGPKVLYFGTRQIDRLLWKYSPVRQITATNEGCLIDG